MDAASGRVSPSRNACTRARGRLVAGLEGWFIFGVVAYRELCELALGAHVRTYPAGAGARLASAQSTLNR